MSANSIALFKNYIDKLDEVYKMASKTAVLEGDAATVRMGANAGEFLVPKMTLDGLGDYSRTDGYTKGGAQLTFETKKADYDRGRIFNIDAMDNEESAGVAFGMLASEFVRTQAVPELDAYRFAKFYAAAGNKTAAALATGAAVIDAIAAATSAMTEKEVDENNRYLFITPTLNRLIKQMDSYKSTDVLSTFAGVIEVPQTRFYTAIDLKDGSSEDEKDGGFEKNASAKDINFMIVHKPAVLEFTKHTVNKVITPEENQSFDGYSFHYRAYGIAEAYDNKVNGIYVHTGV